MKLKALVIDDDPQVRQATVDMLEELGHEAFWAPDVDKGLRLADAHELDLLVTDIMMPGKQGYDAILELKQKRPGVKIVAMSGGTTDDTTSVLDVAERLGADHTLPKPFGLSQLREALTAVFGESV